MYLLLDLSAKDLIHLALFSESSIVHKEAARINRELLATLQDFLAEQKLDKAQVGGIMVVVGAGGFTSTRIATVVANVFASVLQIPLLAIQKDDVEHIQQLIPILLARPKGQYLSAAYSGEPNITSKKHQPLARG